MRARWCIAIRASPRRWPARTCRFRRSITWLPRPGGADIPLVPYATYGTPELAAYAAAALATRNACLLANHGQIAIGAALEDALELAEEVEVLAAQYVTARLLGAPVLLPADEMARVAERFKTYGKAANPPEPERAKPKRALKPRKR